MKSVIGAILAFILVFAGEPSLAKPSKKARVAAKQRRIASKNLKRTKAYLSKKASVLRSKLARNPKDTQTRVQLGETYFDLEEYQKAIETLKPYMPDLTRRGLLLIAKSYRAKKNYLDEIRILKVLLQLNPTDYLAHYDLGVAHYKIDKREDALSHYRKAIEIQPRYQPPYEGLIKAYQDIGNDYETRIIIQDMIKAFGSKAKYFTELCNLFTKDGYLSSSLEYCKKAIEKDPKEPSNHVNLGLTYKNMKNEGQAMKILFHVAKQFPRSELAQVTAGQLSEEQNNFSAAYRYYSRAVKANKNSAPAHMGRARSAFELMKYGVALASLKHVCADNKEAVELLRSLSYRLRRENKVAWYQKFQAANGSCIAR